jgi:hypothetical protein
VRARLERGGDRVTDLHLWQVGPGPLACIVALVSDAPRAPSTYKARLSDILALSHVTVEVEPCPAAPALAQGGLRLTPAKRDYVGFLDVVGRGVTSPPPSALHQSSQPGLASNEQLFERLRLRDAPLGGNLRRLPPSSHRRPPPDRRRSDPPPASDRPPIPDRRHRRYFSRRCRVARRPTRENVTCVERKRAVSGVVLEM